MNPILETNDLTHVYSAGTPFEQKALDRVNFAVYPGEFLGIIGHTGSGKSTLIQHLNGLLQPTSGSVLFNGRDIWEEKSFTRLVRFHVGLVFQYPEYQLFEETVFRDIAFGPQNMGLSESEVKDRVHEAAGFVELPDSIMDVSPFELSGGQKRRVAIAGVIAMNPDVLILDEPTSGLDPQGAQQILSNLRHYQSEKNAAVIMVSHSMEEVAGCVSRIVVINDQRLAMDGSPQEVFTRADELDAMGLAVPQVTQIFRALRQRGIPVSPAVYTPEQAVAELSRLKGGDGNA